MTSRPQQIRTPTGLRYGEAGALEEAQRGAPLPDNRGGPGPASAGGPAGAPPGVPDVFGPTARPNEPITAGAAEGAGTTNLEPDLPQDPAEMLRAIYLQHPSPGIRRLLEKATGR